MTKFFVSVGLFIALFGIAQFERSLTMTTVQFFENMRTDAWTNITRHFMPAAKVELPTAASGIVFTGGEFTAVWNQVTNQLKTLSPADQTGLDRVYAQAQQLIEKQGSNGPQVFKSLMPHFSEMGLYEGYFTITAWMRYSDRPERLITAFLNFEPSQEMLDKEDHKFARLETFALHEFRQQLEAGEISMGEAQNDTLIEALGRHGAQDTSLNSSLEVFQLLSDLHADTTYRSALGQRSENEQQLISGVVAGDYTAQ